MRRQEGPRSKREELVQRAARKRSTHPLIFTFTMTFTSCCSSRGEALNKRGQEERDPRRPHAPSPQVGKAGEEPLLCVQVKVESV